MQEAVIYNPEKQEVICGGDWDLPHAQDIHLQLEKISFPKKGKVIFIGKNIHRMDSAGATLLVEWVVRLEQRGLTVVLEQFAEEHLSLISIVEKNLQKITKTPILKRLDWLQRIGKSAYNQVIELHQYLAFVGMLTFESLRIFGKTKRFRISAIADVIYKNGYLALPIIALLSFMIGVVITYQMGIQLRNYGANIYIVDLLGIAILREFAPLLTAIMVAGRTGSSYTAQLGMMKINQEIDALNTMGVTPAELLILPRITGLFVALPLLTMWSCVFGVVGGMVMAHDMLSITWTDFMHRFPQVVKLKSLMIGLGKTPVFALLIASIGCFQGIQVEGSAESVGRNTTRSVVLSIFFIIVADAIFSIIFSKLGL